MTSSKSTIVIYAGPSCYCISVVTKVGFIKGTHTASNKIETRPGTKEL